METGPFGLVVSRSTRLAGVVLAAAIFVLLAPHTAAADHVPTNVGSPAGLPIDTPALQRGEWRFIANFPAAPGATFPLGVDWEPFTRDGKRYVVASSMTMGLTIFDLTDPNEPVRVADYSSAFGCPHADAAFGADVAQNHRNNPFVADEAALGATSGWENDMALTPDGRIALIGADAVGRCHDPKWGGVEIVDLSDVENPRLLHLVRNTGMSHSISIDPYHPWLAYNSTSDGEDAIEIIDFSSCVGGTRETCRPGFERYQMQPPWTKGFEDTDSYGCHDVRFRPTRMYCAAINASLIFDTTGLSGAGRTLAGQNLAASGAPAGCTIEDADPVTAPGVAVTDCRGWTNESFRASKAVRNAPLRMLGVARHAGRGTKKPPNQDVQISHQAEALDGGRLMFVTDERGGGLNAVGSDGIGPEGNVPACPGGGITFYNVTDERNPRRMHFPDGSPAIFITQNYVQTGGNCTVHYGTEFDDENLLVFAWYSQGTHVMRYTTDYAKNQITLEEVATYIPAASSTWTAKGLTRIGDELFVFTTDIVRGFDVLAVTIPRQTSGAAVPKPSRVLGTKFTRLADTGLGETTTASALLLIVAVALGSRVRRNRA